MTVLSLLAEIHDAMPDCLDTIKYTIVYKINLNL